MVRLSDVARVELGSESYNNIARLNGHPASGMSVQLAPGADALRTAELVRAEVERQSVHFPPGYKYAFPQDSTDFVRLSIEEVVWTLLEAILLVVIVMFVFLQSWRATLIPAIAVPVVLLGTFGVLSVAGFTINTLTLFAMVLAIGLLVDDAIVVVENVERVMREQPGISAREATIKSMAEIQTALIAIALVCPPCSCRWRSSAVPSARSTVSSPSRWWPPWRSPSWWRWCSRLLSRRSC